MLSRVTGFIGLAIVGCALMAQPASGQWRQIADFINISSLGSFHDAVEDLYFLDLPGPPRIGFASTYSGHNWKTTDGGRTWDTLPQWGSFLMADSLTGFWFFDSVRVQIDSQTMEYHYHDSIVFFRTEDAGASWKALPIPSTTPPFLQNFTALKFNTVNRFLYAYRDDSNLFFSTDLGTSWTYVSTNGTGALNGFSFFSDSLGLCEAGENAFDSTAILRTTDGGFTWHRTLVLYASPKPGAAIGVGQPLVVSAEGMRTAFMATIGEVQIYRTDDFGETWRLLYDFGPYFDSTGYRLGPSGTGIIEGDLARLTIQSDTGMFISTDEGLSWQYDGGPAAEAYEGDGAWHEFYSGKGVTIAALDLPGIYTDRSLWEEAWGAAGVAEPTCIDSSLSVISVSENPLHEATTLYFTLTDAEYVRVELFDVLGNAAKMAAPREQGALLDAGVHTMPISLTGLPSGTYYLRITLGQAPTLGEVRTIKLVKE